MRRISELPQQQRPRERLLASGPKNLSDVDLLCVLLGSGTKRRSVRVLARRVLDSLDNSRDCLELKDLLGIEGIGTARAAKIAAAKEFWRRRFHPQGVAIVTPNEVLPLIGYLTQKKQEHFVCITLNGAQEVIANRVISIGLVNQAQVHPREVFTEAIRERASAIIIAHNHPAGDSEPSDADKKVTETLKQAGKLLGIPLLDHIIISRNGYFSFAERGEL